MENRVYALLLLVGGWLTIYALGEFQETVVSGYVFALISFPLPLFYITYFLVTEEVFTGTKFKTWQKFLLVIGISLGSCFSLGGIFTGPMFYLNKSLNDNTKKSINLPLADSGFFNESNKVLKYPYASVMYQGTEIVLKFSDDQTKAIERSDSVTVFFRKGYFGYDYVESFSLISRSE